MNKVNVAIQVLPKSKEIHEYDIIDKAIECIIQTGLNYKVCPFETVVEGEFDEIIKLVEDIKNVCFRSGADEIIMNLKIQARNNSDVYIEEKMEKYE